jgi:REP-associated tyrosine transposase
VDRPRNWTAIVNEAMNERALDDLRTSVNRGRPWGDAAWVQRTAQRLGLLFTLRNPGRPRQKATNE